MTQWILILISLIMANIPWMFNDFLFVKKFPSHKKPFFFSLLEVLILYFVTGGVALFTELQVVGHIQSQAWEFYAVTFFLFLVFSFPGFIFKTLWK
mgnify:CR=1 FL=1|jgi:hypothetical protein